MSLLSCSSRCLSICFSAASVLGMGFKQGVMGVSSSGSSTIQGSGEQGGEGTMRVWTLLSIGVLLCTFSVADLSFEKLALNS